jgi:hypothetical protein
MLGGVVIGGAPRSGTTLLLSVLSCHPALYAIPEETSLLCPEGIPDVCPPPDLAGLELLLAHSDIPATARRWVEKTPRNATCFAVIHHYLPDAALIHLVRDGRDVATSCHPNHPQHYWDSPAQWVDEVSAGLAYPGALLVHYEHLVSDYRATVGAVLDHIGEDWHPNLDDYPRHATVTASGNWHGGAAVPVHTAGVGRWALDEHRDRVEQFHQTPGADALLARLRIPVGAPA